MVGNKGVAGGWVACEVGEAGADHVRILSQTRE